MENLLSKPTQSRRSLAAIARINSLVAVFIAIVLVPLCIYYAPLVWDRYGKMTTLTLNADGVTLTYPARWESYTQAFESVEPGEFSNTLLVVAPPHQRDSIGGVEVRTYASEQAYLTEMNAGKALSLQDFLAATKGTSTAMVAGSQHPFYFTDGQTFPSVCFVVPGSEHLHTLCADGTSSPSGLTPAQRLVLERAVLH